MEGRSQNVLIFLIAIVIGVAVVASFGLNIFTTHLDTIPVPAPLEEDTTDAYTDGQEGGTLIRVEVTTETVQSVIGTMSRPESYYRQVVVQNFWGDFGEGITTAEVWVDYGWTYTVAIGENGIERSSIVGDDTLWWWYEGDGGTMEAPADQWSADVEGQRIPTYEDIMDLNPEDILAAGYEMRGELSCIYVSAEIPDLGYVAHYWVSEESGLLVAAETWDGESLISTMISYDVERPVPTNTAFALPDGKILHRVGGGN